jgi:WD40 repeat protein
MFAVGSQDGVVSVWDVRYLKDRLAILRTQPRQSKKICGIQTTQAELSRWGMLLGQGSGLLRHFAPDDILALLGWDDEECMGKTYGVRSLKFSRDRRGGRGVLVFSEVGNQHPVRGLAF